jgi:hypothetical protein
MTAEVVTACLIHNSLLVKYPYIYSVNQREPPHVFACLLTEQVKVEKYRVAFNSNAS